MPVSRRRAGLTPALVLALAGCGSPAPGPTSAVVSNVVDGDTIDLDSGERIRYLLVDTPESTGGATDCFGQNAKQFNTDLVLGKTIELGYDVEPTDRFGRLVLRRHEKLEALAIGAGTFGGVALAAAGLGLHRGDWLIAGLLLVFSCIPLACTFDNSRALGRWLFGTAGSFAWVTALALLVIGFRLVDPDGGFATITAPLVLPSIIICAASSWLGNIAALRQRR